MAEPTRFEVDLAEALRAYAADAAVDVRPRELVRHLAATHPRRTTTLGSWRLQLAPAVVWILVLGALLLAATAFAVGAGLLRSTDLSVAPIPSRILPAPLAACPPGTDPNAPGPAGQARPEPVYAYPMAFDSRAGRVVTIPVVTRDDTVVRYQTYDEAQTWTFDVCTNTWQRMHPTTEGPRITSTLVYDPDADLTLGIGDRRIWAYDLSANTWTARETAVPAELEQFARLVHDPVSGLVIALRGQEGARLDMWTYAVEADTWAPMPATGTPSTHKREVAAYDGSINCLVVYDGELPGSWLFDPRTGVWTESAAETPPMGFDWAVTGGELAYDAATRQAIAFSGGKVVAYDGLADRWAVLLDPRGSGEAPGPSWIGRPTVVYDSVNRRLLVYGSECYCAEGRWTQPSDVLAFDPAGRTWTTLLAAAKAEAAPTVAPESTR